MNTVDIISGLIIGGVGSFLAAALMLLARSNSEVMASGLRVCAYAFVIMGMGLSQAALISGPYAEPARLILSLGPILGLLVFGYGFNLVHGVTPNGVRWVACSISAVVLIAAAYLHGERALAVAVAAGCLAYSMVLAVYCWPHLRSRHVLAQRVLGVVILGVIAVSLVRLIQTLVYQGPVRDHLLYVPVSQLWFHALFYGVMPLMTGVMLLSIINAHLAQRLELFVHTDELTKSLSRRGLRTHAPHLIANARKAKREVAVLMLDLDNFKTINDRYGHQFGDVVLYEVAQQLRDELRGEALLSRYGGEEFLALIPVETKTVDTVVAERLRRAVRRLKLRGPAGQPVLITVSIGCSLIGKRTNEQSELDGAIARADQALYDAKAKGRDRVQLNLAIV